MLPNILVIIYTNSLGAQLSCLWTSVIVGTKLIAPPVTTIVGLPLSARLAAMLI